MKNSDKQKNGKNPAEGPHRGSTDSTPSLSAPSKTNEGSPYTESLVEMSASIPRLRAFTAAISTAGLGALLRDKGPFTIFAPTDHAFEKIPSDERAALLGDSARLADLLRHHVVSGRVKAPRVKKPRKVTPEFGEPLKLTASDRGFHVDEARIVKTNIRASNGVIHAIDTVLDPRDTAS
jgi:uncharacterized surface protein with fasciclin (FAS1) repeats